MVPTAAPFYHKNPILLLLSSFMLATVNFRLVRPDLFFATATESKRLEESSGGSYEKEKPPPVLAFVHTFETPDQCAMVCPRACVMQIMEELEMMQRWICDPSSSRVQKAATQTRRISNGRSHELGEGEEDDDFELLHNQVLLIIVPLALLLILCLIILMRRCCFSSSVSDNI